MMRTVILDLIAVETDSLNELNTGKEKFRITNEYPDFSAART
jgi:hypothetical protein